MESNLTSALAQVFKLVAGDVRSPRSAVIPTGFGVLLITFGLVTLPFSTTLAGVLSATARPAIEDIQNTKVASILFLVFGFMLVFLGMMQSYLSNGSLNPFATDRTAAAEPTTAVELSADRQAAVVLQNRLLSEIGLQGFKANTNLGLGAGGAVLALAVLGWTVLAPNVALAATPMIYWSTFVAKLTLSFTISVFAFFFLSTYRRNLSEIRYFHNELTNVESRLLAVELHRAITLIKPDRGDEPLLDILKSLATTERNFVLRKGESTVDLSQKDLDRQEVAAWAASLAAAMLAASPPPKKGGSPR